MHKRNTATVYLILSDEHCLLNVSIVNTPSTLFQYFVYVTGDRYRPNYKYSNFVLKYRYQMISVLSPKNSRWIMYSFVREKKQSLIDGIVLLCRKLNTKTKLVEAGIKGDKTTYHGV